MDYIFRCTKNLVLRYQVSDFTDIFHANEPTVCNSIIHRYSNIYIPTSFLDFDLSSPFLFALLIFLARKANTPSFDSISILSILSFSLSSLSLIHQSRSILFPLFYFAAQRKIRVEHVYLRECILSRFDGRIRVTYTEHGNIACALFVSFALLFRF